MQLQAIKLAANKKREIVMAKQKREIVMAKQKREIKSKFLEESEKGSDMILAPTLSALIFSSGEKPVDEKKVERLNLPTMVKPGQIPVWAPENPIFLRAEVVKICDSPNSTIKGKLLWLRLGNGTEITFPCTGVIRNALAPGVKDDDTKLTAALEKYIGQELLIKRTPDKEHGKFKKAMFMFDVALIKK